MLNVLALRNGAIPDPMTGELLAKAMLSTTRTSKERSAINSCEKWRILPSELSKKYEKWLQTFLQKAWNQFEFSSMRWLKNTRDHMKL
jgi:hypothetical protein